MVENKLGRFVGRSAHGTVLGRFAARLFERLR